MAKRKGGRKIPQHIKDEREFDAFRNQPATIEAVIKLVAKLEIEINEKLIRLSKRLNELEEENGRKKCKNM